VVAGAVAPEFEQRRRVGSAEQRVVAAAVAEHMLIERGRFGVDEAAVVHPHLLPH
jgi:hypothetical protein